MTLPPSWRSSWTPAWREAYANDHEAAQWMPPLPDAHCRSIGEWVATKLRWGLTADQGEADALKVYAEACATTVVHYTPSP
ncbi:hypothetical protein [Streptomyces sp. NPDC018038]|uniref:hypothetical protein n=1 Tax=Streptomyces sp. NPDC018038 TaxID=3365036 RepID=UPI0037977BF1